MVEENRLKEIDLKAVLKEISDLCLIAGGEREIKKGVVVPFFKIDVKSGLAAMFGISESLLSVR